VQAATAVGLDIIKRIQNTRKDLLDLSARNRLISTPRASSPGRKVEIVDERSEEVFRLLVRERKSMSFLPGAVQAEKSAIDDPAAPCLAQPDDITEEGGTIDPRYTDLRLQTRLTSERLQARLLDMYYDAQTYEQEQGVSILYLATGFLKWYESASSDNARYAPLLLIPVDLERPSAASRFHLRYRDEDVTTNLSLQIKLKGDFGIALPDIPEIDEISPEAYFDAVTSAIADQPRWEVLGNDMVVWFFSFAKYLMYRDLDPSTWPEHAPLGSNPTLSSLLGEGFASEPRLCGESEKIDTMIPATSLLHVTDADSSQAVVIEEVRRGRHLVVQGPPGTGKSQTITNLIATAVKEGKKVLFVAEKMAALDVVHSRLERLGLGSICLELHSNKANKKAVLEELARTLALGRPKALASTEAVEGLQAVTERLNGHAEVMNTPLVPSGLTPYQLIGRLAALYGRGVDASNLGLVGLESWTSRLFRDRCRDVEDLQAHLNAIGCPGNHPWRGVNRTEPILHAEFREFLDGLADAVASLEAIDDAAANLTSSLGMTRRDEFHLKDAYQLAQFAVRLVNAPPMDRRRIADRVWDERTFEIAGLVERGRALADARYRKQYLGLVELGDHLARTGPPSDHPCRGFRRIEPVSHGDTDGSLTLVSESIESLREILGLSRQLEESLCLETRPDGSLRDIQQLAQLALRIVKAPRMDRSQIDNPIWETRQGEIAQLVKQGQALRANRIELEGKISDVAWSTDLAAARRHLAAYGGSFFRWFNRDYREAVATFKGILKGEPPRTLSARLNILDAVISTQYTSRSMEDDPSLGQAGRDAFGTEWRGATSDWDVLAEVVAWDSAGREARLAHGHRKVLANLERPELCQPSLNALSTRLRPSFDRLKSLLESLDFDCNQAFGVNSILSVPVRDLVERMSEWRDTPEILADWIGYQACRHRLDQVEMTPTISAIHEGRNTVEEALNDLETKFHQALARDLADPHIERPEGVKAARITTTRGADLRMLGPDAFGSEWKDILSDWAALEAIVNWDRHCREAKLLWNHRQHLSRLDSNDQLLPPLRLLSAHLKSVPNRLQVALKCVEFDVAEIFSQDSHLRVAIHDLLSRLRHWQGDPEGLSKWIGYQVRRKRLNAAGLSPLVAALHEGRIRADAADDQLRVSYYQAVIRDAFRRHKGLSEFDGRSYEQSIEEFRALDERRISMARGEVATAHYDAIPRSSGGEMAVVRREIEKKRRHKPIRQLLKDAGTAILAIKPVFMMSPISVAQYLEPGSVTFDLLLIDEASQVSPVDALGAFARARQVVGGGDDKQLPPSRFFSKMLDDNDSAGDSDGDLNAGDLESILGLCVAQGMSQRMLRWHYRSRHHSLIAVSNREFYENHLYVVPSPTTITAMHGLHFRFVKDGVFDRGNSATNRVEASAIAKAVIQHAKRYPKKSLGVGAFSVSQRDAIRDELEVLQRQHVELATFFSPGRTEPFFVKNLENIQGDQRDVIIISVGYARDQSGYMAMSFGPLSSQGGERRLNVLISRARERCEVFSSITADDIDLQRAKSRGAAALKAFLRYAATGVLDTQEPTRGDYDSDFEKQVALALEGHGYEVHCQVGTAGFIIDLAVVDSARPGRYLLGIECDGATYHSSRSARDRDRLRESVLKDRGWRIHRVWSTDWFHRPGEQLQRMIAAIEKARLDATSDEEAETEAESKDDQRESPFAGTDIDRSEQTEEPDIDDSSPWVVPYVEAMLSVPRETPIHETNLAVLAGIVAKVVEIEGPIHRDEVARRITSLWGLQRTGGRIAEAISKAIESATCSGQLKADPEFVTHSRMESVPVRRRSNVTSANLKKPEMIPQAELRQGIHFLVSDHVGVRRDEISLMIAKVFGFKATSAKLKDLIEKVLARMIDENTISLRDEKLFIP